jgi:hypothetical protein
VYVADQRAQAAVVEHAIRPAAITLGLFALVFAVTALLIVGQAAIRLLATGSPDNPALAALGMTRGQLTAVGLVKVGVAAAIGAMVAAGVAVAASPLMPIGVAALAEPDRVSAPMWRCWRPAPLPSSCCWWGGWPGQRDAWHARAPA